MLVHVKVPLLGHHTSGVRSEWYRDDLEEHTKDDPLPQLKKLLIDLGENAEELEEIKNKAVENIKNQFERAVHAEEPGLDSLYNHVLAPTPITKETGERSPAGAEKIIMVDAALHAIDEILKEHPEALLYGQDVGIRLGGVFREAATLAQKYGTDRVFHTPRL